MYTRSYYPEGEEIKIPENYDGNALREPQIKEETVPNNEEEVLRAPWDVTEKAEEVMARTEVSGRGFGGIGMGLVTPLPVEVANGTAVRDDNAVKTPPLA